jgi:hypothetical protein
MWKKKYYRLRALKFLLHIFLYNGIGHFYNFRPTQLNAFTKLKANNNFNDSSYLTATSVYIAISTGRACCSTMFTKRISCVPITQYPLFRNAYKMKVSTRSVWHYAVKYHVKMQVNVTLCRLLSHHIQWLTSQ